MRNKLLAVTVGLLALTSVPVAMQTAAGLAEGERLSVAMFRAGIKTTMAIKEQPLLAPTALPGIAAFGAGGLLYAMFDRGQHRAPTS